MYKPVSVEKYGFMLCRYMTAILLWLSLVFQLKVILLFITLVFLESAVFGIDKSFFVVLYKYTIGKVVKSPSELLNFNAMRFIHLVALVMAIITLLVWTFIGDKAGLVVLFIFAVLKSLSAIGFCPANKLYACVTGGSDCCRTKKDCCN